MPSQNSVSFTIRPPTTTSTSFLNASRYSSQSLQQSTPGSAGFTPGPPDSSDEDEQEDRIELLTGYDHSGAQRLNGNLRPSGPLVIPPLANRDWRAVARQRKSQIYVPDGVGTPSGEDGSQGGLGTRGTINDGPQVSGLVFTRREETKITVSVNETESVEMISTPEVKLDEDEQARRALLASVSGETEETTITAIPVVKDNFSRPISETDAYREDVLTRPDSASLEDYERIPVSQFGAALLRGMGWKEGTAASKKGRGLVEPWLPASRPALLGLGAKERPAEEIPVLAGKKAHSKQDKRYVPLVKVQKEESLVIRNRSRSRSPERSRAGSRYPSTEAADKSEVEGRGRNNGRGRDFRQSRTTVTVSESRKYDRHDRHSDKDRDRESNRDRRRDDSDYDRRGEDYSRDSQSRHSSHHSRSRY